MHANQGGRNDENHKNQTRRNEGKENPPVSCRQPPHRPRRSEVTADGPTRHGGGGRGQRRQGGVPEDAGPKTGRGRFETFPTGIQRVADRGTSQNSLPGGQGAVSDIPGGRNLSAQRAECSSARLCAQAISCGGTVTSHPQNRQRRSPF